MPTVSCIVPVFNGERFLAEALASIFAQDTAGADLDVIVVDDGSTDRSAAIAEAFSGVRVMRRPNGGVAEARNTGVAAARGDYIGFLDCDDLWLPGKLAAQIGRLEADPGIDLCITQVVHVDIRGGGVPLIEGFLDRPQPGRLMQCLIARADAFDRVGRFDPGTRTRSDQDWFVRARDLGLVTAVVPEVLVHRRIHGANISLTADATLGADFLELARRRLVRNRAGDGLGDRGAPGAGS